MALKQKILVNESAYDEKFVFCESVCDNIANLHRICPPVCEGFCPPDCTLENLEIPPPPPPPPPPEPLIVSVSRGHTLPLGLTVCFAVLATTFFLFTCFTIYKFYSYWRNSRRRSSERRRSEEEGEPDDFLDEEHGPIVDHPIWYIRTIGLQPSVISAITVVRFKRGDGLIDGADCAVCLSEFEEDETLRLLPKCNHAFHIPCIDTWLRSHTTCPLCRAGIVNTAAAAAAATPSPSPELAVQNSGPAEENQLEIAVGESAARDSESEASREDRITRSESGFKMDNSGGLGLQSVRRSVSVDSVSASMISAAVARAFPNNQLVEDSSERSGNYWMKRSVSCSSKALSSRRHQNSQ